MLLFPIFLIWVVMVVLYFPPIQKHVVDKLCNMVSENTDFDLSIAAFAISLPLKATVEDFTLSKKDTTLIEGKQLALSIRPVALLKGEIEINYLSILETEFNSGNLIDGTSIIGRIGHFRTTIRNINPLKKHADIRQVHLADCLADITLSPQSEEKDTTDSTFDWLMTIRRGSIVNTSVSLKIPSDSLTVSGDIPKISLYDAISDFKEQNYSLDKSVFKNIQIKYDNGEQHDSIAPLEHLEFRNINIVTDKIAYNDKIAELEIKELSLQQPDGIEIISGQLYATKNEKTLRFQKIDIESGNGTYISGNATLPTAMQKNGNGQEVNGNISMNLNRNDLKKLLPADIYKNIEEMPDSTINAHIRFRGNTKATIIDTLCISLPHTAYIGAEGMIRNLYDNKKTEGEIEISGKINDLHKAIYRHRPDSIPQHAAYLDGHIGIKGNEYSGNLHATAANSKITVAALFDTEKQSYTGQAEVSNLNIAGILPEIPLHALSLHVNATGNGFDIFAPETQYICNAHIDTIYYDGYSLHEIALNAKQEKNIADFNITSDDPDLQMNMQADAKLDTAAIDCNVQINIAHAELQQLQLTNMPASAQMQLHIGVYSDMHETHKANLVGKEFKLVTKEKTYTPSELHIGAFTAPDTTYINISTGDLNIKGTSSSGYHGLQTALAKTKELYKEAVEDEHTIYYIQDFEKEIPETQINIESGQENLLANYLEYNGIYFDKFNMKCHIDSIDGINANGYLYHLRKNDFMLDTIKMFIKQSENEVRYFASIRTKDRAQEIGKNTLNAAVFGNLKQDSLRTNLIIRDSKDNIGTQLGLNTLLKPEGLDFHFDTNAILFNHTFTFNEDNYFKLGKNFAIESDIQLSDSLDSGLRLYSNNNTTHLRDLSLNIFNLDLLAATNLTPFVPEISGILNADIRYIENTKGTLINGDIFGKDIAYEGTHIGNEIVEISYIPDNNRHIVDFTAYHNENEIINLSGYYDDKDSNPILDADVRFTRFPLKISDAFIKDTGVLLKGYLNGRIGIKGALNSSQTDGYIAFDSVYADAPRFGTHLHLKDGRVNIIDNKFNFNNFEIFAKGNTPFMVNGTIDMKNISNPYFNLRMQTSNYELINSRRQKGNIIYGKMFLDASTYINGRLNSLNMTGETTLLGKSDITYVLQDNPLATKNELDGLVEFVNFSDETPTIQETDAETDFGNMNMNITLTIEEGARINADFDENRNSYIELQGDGQLNLSYSSQAGMSLTGRYTLSNGQLKYSLPIIPLKTFSIIGGSYINWDGDIMNPMINITALEQNTTNVTLEDGNSQAVTFDVGVTLTKRLENMDMSFTMSAPDNAVIQNELNSLDKETLNKYAATMLITGSYLGSKNGITAGNAMSSFLGSQINKLVGSAMGNANVNVGITDIENSATGENYKNYSFSFAKRFWNDRLTVVIGGEVSSGAHTPEENESFINNVSLEWKISESGNRYIRLFYDKNYESILEGEIIETGVGYVYKRKLNNLNELLIFRKKKKDFAPDGNTRKEEEQ